VPRALEEDEDPKVIHFENWRDYVKDYQNVEKQLLPLVPIWRHPGTVKEKSGAPEILLSDIDSCLSTYRDNSTVNIIQPEFYTDRAV
jgi:hypothetical protein